MSSILMNHRTLQRIHIHIIFISSKKSIFSDTIVFSFTLYCLIPCNIIEPWTITFGRKGFDEESVYIVSKHKIQKVFIGVKAMLIKQS
ncbi:MAG: hypothetical protein LBH44_11305 [Treponema sp.]|jgi:hypothetical protein|nr:hypothetical protein [Treponema sp.]